MSEFYFVSMIQPLPVCIFSLSLLTEFFEAQMSTALLTLSTALVVSPIRAWMTSEFHRMA